MKKKKIKVSCKYEFGIKTYSKTFYCARFNWNIAYEEVIMFAIPISKHLFKLGGIVHSGAHSVIFGNETVRIKQASALFRSS